MGLIQAGFHILFSSDISEMVEVTYRHRHEQLGLIQGKNTRCAFVSTNSITQGGAVTNLWKPLFSNDIHIDFAWRTFKWINETSDKSNMAAVHCVIVGFSETNPGILKYRNNPMGLNTYINAQVPNPKYFV